MPDIKTVGIFSKPDVSAAVDLVPKLIDWLGARGIHTRCDRETAAYAPGCETYPPPDVPEGSDLVIVLGGDGTLLSPARAISGRQTPFFPADPDGLRLL